MKLATLALALAAGATHAPAGDPATRELAAGLLTRNAGAIVEVQATLKITPKILEAPEGLADQLAGQMGEQEQNTTAKGVVVDPSGLVAVPLVMLDPSQVMAGGMSVETPMGTLRIGMEAAVISTRVIDGEGREYEARLALRDPNSGVALVSLAEPPAEPMSAVTLPDRTAVPAPFETLFCIERMDAEFGRAPLIRRVRFVRELPAPNPVYAISTPADNVGFAAFDAAGRFTGLGVVVAGEGATPEAVEPTPVVLPAHRITPLARKVLDAR